MTSPHQHSQPRDHFLNIFSSCGDIASLLHNTRHQQIPYLDNYLTRLLSFDIESERVSCNTGTRDCFVSNEIAPFQPITEDHLQHAKRVVQSEQVLVALASEPELSLRRICSLFSMRPNCFGKSALSKMERSKNSALNTLNDTSENILEELERRNYWDLKLVQYLTTLFYQQNLSTFQNE